MSLEQFVDPRTLDIRVRFRFLILSRMGPTYLLFLLLMIEKAPTERSSILEYC